jgi:hypothetical protein
MNYQAIRAALENPLLAAFGALSPAVPVFFDNITAVPANTTTEYVRINITFGITNEPTLTSSVDNARGALDHPHLYRKRPRSCPQPNPADHCRQRPRKPKQHSKTFCTGTFMRLGEINGPTFSSTDEAPHFVGRIDTSWVATVLT